MQTFREKLSAALEASKFNKRSLSLAAGLGERTIANLLNSEDVDTTATGPGLFSMARVCDELDISLDWLAGRQEAMRGLKAAEIDLALTIQRFKSATPHDTEDGAVISPSYMMRQFVRSGGMLEGFRDVLSYCDRYAPPNTTDEPVKLIAQGANSLSAITMGGCNRDVRQMALNAAASNELRKQLLRDHIEAKERGCLTTVESLNIQMPNRPIRTKMDYTRVILNVENDDGERENLVYSSLII